VASFDSADYESAFSPGQELDPFEALYDTKTLEQALGEANSSIRNTSLSFGAPSSSGAKSVRLKPSASAFVARTSTTL
jgi:hypothetical protein